MIRVSARDEVSEATLRCFDKLKERCNEHDFVVGILSFVPDDEGQKKIIDYLDSHPDADKWKIMKWVFCEFVEKNNKM